MQTSSTSVVIVTHNSERFIHKNVEALTKQTLPAQRIVIVDSGSRSTSYLDPYRARDDIVVVEDQKDIGFCAGNNSGMKHIHPDSHYVLFLNPDAFLQPNFLERAQSIINTPENNTVGCLSGPLLGFDIDKDTPTGRYDSTGVYRTWYGKWYDRDQGHPTDSATNTHTEHPTAICGALMFCRREALQDILLRGTEVWDSTFYMYKDDIDLSLRLKKSGWKLLFVPDLPTYHCRGWNTDRKCMPREFRLMSARNELRINARHCLPGLLYSSIKYCAVRFANI